MEVDKLQLYRWAVQDPSTHAQLVSMIFARVRGAATARLLREDFAGTSADAIAWVAGAPQRSAIAVDMDRPTLAWARASARLALGGEAARVRFVESDVLEAGPPDVPPADVTTALNFSAFYFHDRRRLLAYLRHARAALAEHGVLIFNAFGGAGAMQVRTDARTVQPPAPAAPGAAASTPREFLYEWEQRAYDAVTNRLDCRIHFTVPPPEPGAAPAQVRDAFRYDYRLWTLPELVEMIREAGFADAQIWRHTYDPARGAAGVFLGPVEHIPVEHIGTVQTWTAYLVAVR